MTTETTTTCRLAANVRSGLRTLVVAQFFTLYYHQRLVDHYGVHHDARGRFRRSLQYLLAERLPLVQFRKLYPQQGKLPESFSSSDKDAEQQSLPYPLIIRTRFPYLTFLRAFFAFFVLRCGAIVLLPGLTTDQRWKRVWSGTECFQSASTVIETTFFLWSSISVLFLTVNLTDKMLDYKFMALYRVTDKVRDAEDEQQQHHQHYCTPQQLELTTEQYRRFERFRSAALLYYCSIMASIPSCGPSCILLLTYRAQLYSTDLTPALIWTPTLSLWIFWVCTVIYSNLVAFLVVAKYVHVKQQNTHQDQGSFAANPNTSWWRPLLSLHRHHIGLQAELQEYNRFWTKYLTYIFVLYVMLICYLTHIILLTDTVALVKLTYSVVLSAHVILLGAIIFYCGGIVKRVRDSSRLVTGVMGHLRTGTVKARRGSTGCFLKMNHLSEHLASGGFGFSLQNGYIISYDTFRLLIANIVVYFLLILTRFRRL